jgi:hypothetical protein
MRLRPAHLLFLAVLVAVSLANTLNAQTTTSGSLAGVVTDPMSAVLPDADVLILDNAKGTTQSTKTDREGVYRFFFLAPGRYTLTVAHDGFRKEKRLVEILLGPPVSANISLALAKISSEITVSDEAPVVHAEDGDTSTTMNQKQVSELPNPGNDLTYIAQTVPGAVMNTDGGFGSKFSILGMPGFSYNFTVDGMSITENSLNIVRGGSLGLALGANQIQEATIVTSGYSGQFGGAAGGNINYVSKSGSNEFHGNAQYYWNGRVLNANDWFIKAGGNPRPFSIANQWADSFGGPVRKNKVFFFFDTEGLRLVIPQVLFTVIPTPEFEAATIANIRSKFGAGSASDIFYNQVFNLYDNTPGAASAKSGGFGDSLGCSRFLGPNGLGTTAACARNFTKTRSRPSQDTLTSGRVDWNLGQNDRTFFRIQEENGVGAFYTDPINSVFDGDYDNSQWQGELLEVHTFSPSTASQFLVGVSNHYWAYKAGSPRALGAFPTVLNFSVPGTFTNLGGVDNIGSYGIEIHALQLSEDLARTHGSHKFGLGVHLGVEHWLVASNTVDTIGQLYPQTVKAFYQGGVDPAAPSIDFTSLVQSFTSQPNVSVGFGGLQAYAQDEWRARTNLGLTLALRTEYRANFWCDKRCFAVPATPFEEISHDPNQPYNQVILTNQRHAFQKPDRILWSPRFGFAWQPFGVSHDSVLRGGVGVFYDPFQEALAEPFYINAPIYNSYEAFGDNLTPNETSSLFKDTAASNAAFVNGFAAGETVAQLRSAIPNFSPPALSSAERRMHHPQYQRWSLEWEQGLDNHTSLNLGYFGHHGIHELVANPNANAFGFGTLPAGQCDSPPVPPCSDPRFSKVTEWGTNAISNYHGMVASFRHQFTRWGNGLVQLNYTYGRALDEVSNSGIWSFTQGSSLAPQDPKNLRGSYGPAEYDVRHSMNANYVWELPLKAFLRGRGPDALLQGWQISGTLFARTGFPYSVFDMAQSGNLQQNNYFGQIYSVPAGPLPKGSACGEAAAFTLNLQPCQPPQFFVQPDGSSVPNPNARFIQATCETGFNVGHLGVSGVCDGPAVSFSQGRNRFRGPRYFNTDLAIMKHTKIPGWENGTLGIGFQFFNVLNHPNFGTPEHSSSDPAFGLIFYDEQSPTSILGSGLNAATAARMIQVKAELRF